MNITGFLIFIGLPVVVFSAIFAILLRNYEAYKALKAKKAIDAAKKELSGATPTAKPVSVMQAERIDPPITETFEVVEVFGTTDIQSRKSGATALDTRTIAGKWFSAPDVSHLETPAFLRRQAA